MSVPERRTASGKPDHGSTRRERIAHSAIEVVAQRGVEGLTHRAVAAQAQVPLGSTTYHFATLDDLLGVALEYAASDNIAQLREWAKELPGDVDLPAELAGLVVRYMQDERPRTVVEYELYAAALHRPSLRGVSAAWDEALIEVFGERTDPVTARVLAATFCGLLLQGVLSDPAPRREDVEPLFRRILHEPAAD